MMYNYQGAGTYSVYFIGRSDGSCVDWLSNAESL